MLPAGWLRPEWPVPANVHAACTTRDGGVSAGPFASCNLGDHVGDDPGSVAENRRRFAQALDAHPVFMKQVHRTRTVELHPSTPDGIEADGCITAAPRVACTIMVADCLPVLFATRDGRGVAAAHAGWRGLAGGVLEATCRALWGATGATAHDTLAWLGPCIGPDAFEVGPEVKAEFQAGDPAAASLFRPNAGGKWLADLPGLARRRLAALGLTGVHGNDGGTGWCTVANPSLFFSHRRDRGTSGRFAAAVWRG